MKVDRTKLENKLEMNIKEIYSFLMSHRNMVWSWGAKSWTDIGGKGLAFSVTGFLFKGNVMITLNGSDLFDIYFFNRLGNQVHEINDIFLEDLIGILDSNIEKTDTYEKDVKAFLNSAKI